MNGAKEIRDELRELSSVLADLPKTMPYSVPTGYFSNFTVSLSNNAVSEENVEYIKKWGDSLPYVVPDGYFEAFPGQIAAIVKANGLPVLVQTTPYIVPDSYFAQLPAIVLAQAKKEQPKPRASITFSANVIRLAAAAMVVIGIGVGTQQFWPMPRLQASEGMLSSVSGNDIQEYFQRTYRMDADRVVSNNDVNKMQLENKDIIQYLNETGWD